MAMGLTALQAKCLAFIEERISADGIAPSFIEIGAHLKLSSKSGVYRLVDCLTERGHIRRIPKRARSIEILIGRRTCPHCGHPLGSDACRRAAEAARA